VSRPEPSGHPGRPPEVIALLTVACKRRYVGDDQRHEAVGVPEKGAEGRPRHLPVDAEPPGHAWRGADADPRGTSAVPRAGPPRLLHRRLGQDRGRLGRSGAWSLRSRKNSGSERGRSPPREIPRNGDQPTARRRPHASNRPLPGFSPRFPSRHPGTASKRGAPPNIEASPPSNPV
jgi:hypothetical protein